MSTVVKPDGHLLERKLGEYLKAIVNYHDDCEWIGGQYKIDGSRYRYDFAFSKGETKYLVEFDGPEHYQNANKIRVDWEKNFLAGINGFTLVRIPYFIQFTSQMFKLWFEFDAEIIEDGDFPHGFITTNILPASFCPLGQERFNDELYAVPYNVYDNILDSLFDWEDKLEESLIHVNHKQIPFFVHPMEQAQNIYDALEEIEAPETDDA